MTWLADDAIATARALAYSPASGLLTDAELLLALDFDLQSRVFPLVLETGNGWRTSDQDYAITAAQNLYRIPARAHGGKLLDVLLVEDGEEHPLDHIELSRLPDLLREGEGPDSEYWWMFRDGSVMLYETPDVTAKTLRLRYPERPGKLVAASAAARITTIGAAGSGGGTQRRFTCSGGVPAWGATSTLDIVRATGAFETTHASIAAVDITGTLIDVQEALLIVSEIAVGDYFAQPGESPVIQVPADIHAVLVYRAVELLKMAERDFDGVAAARRERMEAEDAARKMLELRAEDEDRVIIPSYSPMRQMHGSRRSMRSL